ncbi:MAG: NADH-quinone oxidoreductase subunit J [Bdellovibrionales bacterium]|nr:NADH-quinone oxidoreductase subunit J [Bdellovibrionales bacterium]
MEYLFYTFSGLAILFSLGVVFARNPIYSGLSLVTTLFFVSGIFVLLHAPFIGVLQILVYTGAIMVLFLYVMMLLNIQEEQIVGTRKHLMKWMHLPLIVVIFFIFKSLILVPTFSDIPVDEKFGSVFNVGESLLGSYVLVFEIASIVLLAAMIGVVVLTKKTQKEKP